MLEVYGVRPLSTSVVFNYQMYKVIVDEAVSQYSTTGDGKGNQV